MSSMQGQGFHLQSQPFPSSTHPTGSFYPSYIPNHHQHSQQPQHLLPFQPQNQQSPTHLHSSLASDHMEHHQMHPQFDHSNYLQRAGPYDARHHPQNHPHLMSSMQAHPHSHQAQHGHPIPTLPSASHQSFFYPNQHHHPPPSDLHPHQSMLHHHQQQQQHQQPLQSHPASPKKRSAPSVSSAAPAPVKKPRVSRSSTSTSASAERQGENTVTVFQCAGYGDCRMTFTRSEHLARHIRKHTGERPFVCHCGKAFSRLDNLRQHANTVHVDAPDENEKTINDLSALHAQLAATAAQQQHAHTQTLPRAQADALVQASAEQNGRKKKASAPKKPKEEKRTGSVLDERKPSGATSFGDPSISRRTSNQTPLSHHGDSYYQSNGMGGGHEDPYASPYATHPPADWHGPPGGDSFYSTPREHGSFSGSGHGSGSGDVHFRNSYDSNGGPSIPSYFHPQEPHSHPQHQGHGSYYAYDAPSHLQHAHSGPSLQHHAHNPQYVQGPHQTNRPHQPDSAPYSPGYDHYSTPMNERLQHQQQQQNPSFGHHQHTQQQHVNTSRYGIPNEEMQSSREDAIDVRDSYYHPQNSQYATPGSGSGASASGSFSADNQQPSSSYQSTLSAHLHMRTPTMSRQSLPPKEESPPPPSSVLLGSDLLSAAAHDRPILPPLASLSRPGTAGGVGGGNVGGSFSLLAAGGGEDRRPSIALGSLGLGAIGRGSIDVGRGSIDASSSSVQGSVGTALPSIGAHLSAAESSSEDRKTFSSPDPRASGPGLAPISDPASGQDSSCFSLPGSLRSNSIGGPSERLKTGLLQEANSAGSFKPGDVGGSRPNTTGGSKPGSSLLASMAATVNERLSSRPTSSSRLTSLANLGGGSEDMKAPPISSMRSGSNNEAQSDIKISPPSNSSPFMFQPPPLPGVNGSASVAWNTTSPFGARRPSSLKLNGGGFLTSRRRGSEELVDRIEGKEKPVLATRPGSSSGTGTPKVEDENKEFFRRPFTSGGESIGRLSNSRRVKEEEEDDDFFPPPPSGAGLDSRRVSIASLVNDDRDPANQLFRPDLFSSGGSRLSFGGGEIFSSKWWSSSNGIGSSGFSRPGTSSRDPFASNHPDIINRADEMAAGPTRTRRNSSAPPVTTPGEERVQEFTETENKRKSDPASPNERDNESAKRED